MSLLTENNDFWKNPIVVVLGAITAYIAIQLVGVLIVLPFVGFVTSKNAQSMLLLIGVFIAFVVMLMGAKKVLKFQWSSIGVAWGKLRYVAFVPIVFALYVAVSTVLMSFAQKIPGFNADQTQDVGLSATNGNSVLLAGIVLVVITPLFEELFFRGILFHGLRRRLSFLGSAVVASVLFAIAHGQANVAVDTFALGIMLCLITERSRSLLPGIALHALKNFIAFGVLFLGWFK